MTKSFLASAVLALGLASQANAAPVQWSVADGGNDHWYEVVWLGIGQITWNTANSSATSSSHLGQTGYLATITSAAEQAVALAGLFPAARRAHRVLVLRLGGVVPV